jgi:hypothetical protein
MAQIIMQTLNLDQLKTATATGGVTGITLRGDGAAFVVSIQTQKFEALLATSRKQPRRFADPRKALQLLRGIGWNQCQIDAAQWRPEDRALEKTARPDRSIALKAAHEAAQQDADYDRWFRAKVQASIDGLKDGTNRILTTEEWTQRRADLIARIKARQSAQLTA